MWNYYGHMAWGGIWMIFVWITITALVLWIVREIISSLRGSDRSTPSRAALDILKERYAKGEIDTREFEEKKKIILEESSR